MQLEPCPFCGEALLQHDTSAIHPSGGCWLTGIALQPFEYEGWNRRTYAAAPVPPSCDADIFVGGQVVAVFDCGMLAMEGLIKEANRHGPAMDWHYAGGRAIVKTLGRVEDARKALERALPKRLSE